MISNLCGVTFEKLWLYQASILCDAVFMYLHNSVQYILNSAFNLVFTSSRYHLYWFNVVCCSINC